MRKLAALASLFIISLGLNAQCNWSLATQMGTMKVGNTVSTYFQGSYYNNSANSNIDSTQWDFDVLNGNGPEYTSTVWFDSVQTWSYNSPGTYVISMRHFKPGNCDTTIYDTVFVAAPQKHTDASCGNCNGSITIGLQTNGGAWVYTYGMSSFGAFNLTANNLQDSSITFDGICPGTYWYTSIYLNDTTFFTVSPEGWTSVIFSPDDTVMCGTDSVSITANCVGGAAPYTFNWFNTNGPSQTDSGLTSTYLSSETPLILLEVIDANGCTIEDTNTVTFLDAPTIIGSSTDETCSSCCNGTATATVTGNNLLYYWSNGGSTSTITGLCPGTYSVTVYDSLTTCHDSATVTVNAFVTTCYFVSGTVDQGDDTRVYLIEENSGSLSALDSTTTDATGLYMFSDVCNGTYYIKAALLSSHTYYTAFLPTYFDSAALWNAATSVTINNASNYSVDIEMLAGANAGGPGFIGGLISQGANRGEGDPIVGAYVIAYNENGSVAAFDQTDASGAYELSNLALGTYEVYVDVLNKTAYPHQVSLSEEISETTNRDFEVIGSIIKPIAPTGLEDISSYELNVFPNPTDGYISINSGSAKLTSVIVLSLLGERVMELNAGTQNHVLEFDLSNLAAGTYILELTGEDFLTHQSIVIR